MALSMWTMQPPERRDWDKCSGERCSKDVVDLLPSDPFGMDTDYKLAAVSRWLDDLCTDIYWSEEVRMSIQHAALDCFWKDVLSRANCSEDRFGEFSWMSESWEECSIGSPCIDRFSEYSDDTVGTDISSDFDGGSVYDSFRSFIASCDGLWDSSHVERGNSAFDPIGFGIDDCFCKYSMELRSACFPYCCESWSSHLIDSAVPLGCGTDRVVDTQMGECSGASTSEISEGGMGSPHLALSFVLNYLSVRDLLAVEMVCTSFRSTIREDPLLWQNICIEKPLNEIITDDILLDLTRRSQGALQSLCLVECSKITDDCLRAVFQNNSKLSKLSVSGCTRISIDRVIDSVRATRSKLKQLRVGGLYGISLAHFEELKILLGIESPYCNKPSSPHYYQGRNFYLSLEDNRALDLELCPKCLNPRLLYDCPLEVLEGSELLPTPQCRACIICVARCVKCGRCINESEYEETFCLELVCSSCSDEPIMRSEESLEQGARVRHYSFSRCG